MILSKVIHGHPVPSGHKKVEIVKVLNLKKWKDFDQDIHSVGCYVAWPTKSATLIRNKRKCQEETKTKEAKILKVKIPVKQNRHSKTNKPKVTVEDSEESTDNELDYEDETVDDESSDVDDPANKKLAKEREIWKKGGWQVDPRAAAGYHAFGPRLNATDSEIINEIGYFLHFFPVNFVKEIPLPAMNANLRNFVTFEEFLCFLGIWYSMEVQRLPERRMYWDLSNQGIFKSLDYAKLMSRYRFEEILLNLKFSAADDKDDQIIDFLDAVNHQSQEAMRPGDYLCLDESMVKAFHRHLKGKMKIIRKPRPIGNELKTLCDGRSKIVLYAELYEGKEIMTNKPFVNEVGATTATCLRLTAPWKGSGRVVVGDSWFGSVNSVKELWNRNGLYSVMLVKTAHRNYPKLTLRENKLNQRGQWNSATGTMDGVEMLACLFKDLKEKQFISNCSTSLEGEPIVTKHHGEIARPQVAEVYLKMAAGIDIHNHVRTGSSGLEDVWQTKNYVHRQFAGIIGFIFTNSYLAINYFSNGYSNEKVKGVIGLHTSFKIKLANQLVTFKDMSNNITRGLPPANAQLALHQLAPLDLNGRKQLRCYFCKHGRNEGKRIKTSWYCTECGPRKPLCSPETRRDCFLKHIENGMPQKPYKKKD